MTPSRFGANDMGLRQNGGVQYATANYHNRFGINMSIIQRAIGNYPHRVWKGKTNSNYPNPKLERSIWNNQTTIE